MPWQALFQGKAVGFRVFPYACPCIHPYDDFPLFFVPSVSLFSVKAFDDGMNTSYREVYTPAGKACIPAGNSVDHNRD
jgi:hypothetical protein